MMLTAQILRLGAAVFTMMSDKTTEKSKIFLYNGIGNLLCGIQYFLLNAITGGICCILALLRNIIFCKYTKKPPIIILLVYFLIIILCNLGCFTDIISVIPVLLIIIYGLSLYNGDVIVIKIASIVTCLLEIIYDFYCFAYVGVVVCLLGAFFASISIYQIKKKKS